MNEHERFGRQKTLCKIEHKVFNCTKQPGNPNRAVLRRKALEAVAPAAHFFNTHDYKNAKTINHDFFLKIHKLFVGVSRYRIFMTSYEN